MEKHDFEIALSKLKDKLQNKQYAKRAYASLCNVAWIHLNGFQDGNPADFIENNWRKYLKKSNVWWRRYYDNILGIIRNFTYWISHKSVKIKSSYDGKEIYSNIIKERWPLYYIDDFVFYLMELFSVYPPEDPDWLYGCSWRHAAALVAEIRDKGEDYLNFYCSGNEARINPTFAKDMYQLGWKPFPEYYDIIRNLNEELYE